jgi:hypothetical protein
MAQGEEKRKTGGLLYRACTGPILPFVRKHALRTYAR